MREKGETVFIRGLEHNDVVGSVEYWNTVTLSVVWSRFHGYVKDCINRTV